MATTEGLRQLDDDLWIVDAPQRFFGFEIGTRMTVVQLDSGALWVCSPVVASDALRGELDALGPVEHLVGPNRFHHLHLGPMLEHYPRAQLHLCPGLADKRPDLGSSTTLTSTAPPAWASVLDQRIIEGVPTFNEVAFLHRSSRSLILTDHLFHLDQQRPLVSRLLGSVLGVRKTPGFPRDARAMFVRDKAATRRSLDDILAWDFDRVVITHGTVVETGGRQVLSDAYAFLRD